MELETLRYSPQEVADFNAKYALDLGWIRFFYQIRNQLGINRKRPDPYEFGEAVAIWQMGHGNLEVDGVIGPETWGAMKPYISLSISFDTEKPIWLFLPTIIKIKYDVPILVQRGSPVCWAISANMIELYKKRSRTDFLGGLDINNTTIPNSAVPLPEHELYDIYNAHTDATQRSWISLTNLYILLIKSGFEKIHTNPNQDITETQLASLLKEKGPLHFSFNYYDLHPQSVHDTNDFPLSARHAVVITGIDTVKDICYVNDPWGKKDEQISTGLVLNAIMKITSQKYQSLWYLP